MSSVLHPRNPWLRSLRTIHFADRMTVEEDWSGVAEVANVIAGFEPGFRRLTDLRLRDPLPGALSRS